MFSLSASASSGQFLDLPTGRFVVFFNDGVLQNEAAMYRYASLLTQSNYCVSDAIFALHSHVLAEFCSNNLGAA